MMGKLVEIFSCLPVMSNGLLPPGRPRPSVKGLQLFFVGFGILMKAAICWMALVVFVHGRVKIGPHLEDLFHILIVEPEQVIEIVIGNDDHLRCPDRSARASDRWW